MKEIKLLREIPSPVADGMMILKEEPAETEFRGEHFAYTRYFYECKTTGEQFTTTESDTVTTNQIYDEYRRRHDIPFPAELKALRTRCGLSAAKMGAMLGLGINQYRLYEAGEVPSLSVGKILNVLCNSDDTLRRYANLGKDTLGEKKYNALLHAIN